MRLPRFTTLQLLLAAALVALTLGLFTSAWRVHVYQEIEQICFSPNGKLLAGRYASGAVQIWRLDPPRPRLIGQAFAGNNLLGFEQSTIHFIANDTLLKVETEIGGPAVSTSVWRWDLSRGEVVSWMQIAGCLAWPYGQAASPERLLIVDQYGNTNEIQSYLLESKRFERKWTSPNQAAGRMILSADGKTLALLDQNARVQVIDVNSDDPQPRSSVVGAGAAALSSDGRWLATQEALGQFGFARIGVHDLNSSSKRTWVHTRLWSLVSLSFTTDGKRLVASDGRAVECHELGTGRILSRVALDEPTTRAPSPLAGISTPWSSGQIVVAPDGSLLATSQGGQIILRDVARGKVLHVITGGSRLIHILIYTLGFTIWGAAWGIVNKRERLRRLAAQPQAFSPLGPRAANRPLPQIVSMKRHLATLGWLLVAVFGLVIATQILGSFGSVAALILNTLKSSLGIIAVVIASCVAYTWLGALIQGPHYLSLLRLRRLAADPGRLHRRGRLTLWFVGPSRIEADYTRHVDEVLDNADELFGCDVDFQRRTLVACLDRQCDLDAFCGRRIPVAAIVPRMWTDRLALVCEETAAMSLTPPASYLRSALALLILIERKRGYLPFWVATVAAQAMTRNEDRPAQIHGAVRRLKLLLIRQPEFDFTGLFLRAPREQSRMWMAEDSPQILELVLAEWDFLTTLGEMLLGPTASADRRRTVLAWLRTTRPKDDPLATFQQHVGLTLEALLTEWRQWLAAQSGLHYDPLPAEKRWLLEEVATPVLRNPALAVNVRRRMTRQLGQFYVSGAGPLIGLLADPAFPFRREAIESLENLSGEQWGDDERRWRAWWAGLPERTREIHPFDLVKLKLESQSARAETIAGDEARAITLNQTPMIKRNLQPPLELKLCWGLMVVGGVVGLAIPISLMFLTGPLLFSTLR